MSRHSMIRGTLTSGIRMRILMTGDPPPVHVDAPTIISNIDFALAVGGSIAGQVTVDPTGEPLIGCTYIPL